MPQRDEAWRDAVCAEGLTWIATPYVPSGRVKGVAADCGGILYELYNPWFGPLPPYPDYPIDWACHSEEERYLDFIMPFVKQVPECGKGGFAVFHLAKAYAHAAINLGDGTYLHAWGRRGMGTVRRTPFRVLKALAKVYPPKHFEPI